MKFNDIKIIKHAVRKHFNKRFYPERYEQEEQNTEPAEIVPHFVTIGISIFGSLLILTPVVLFALGIGYFEINYHDKFYPGVSVGGEKVGGLTYAEVFKHFREKSETIASNGIPVEFENLQGKKKIINVPVSSPGLSADSSIEYFTVDNWGSDLYKAYKYGRSLNIFRSIFEQATLVFTRKNFDFSTVAQVEAVDSLLESELNIFLKKSKSAEFSFVKNKLSISQEQIGEIVNKDEILNILTKKMSQFDSTPIILKVQEDSSVIKKESLEQFVIFVENFGRKTDLVFKYNGYKWNIKGAKLITWLTLKENNELSINRSKLEEFFADNISKSIENPPRNSRFQIQDGKLVETVSAKIGNVADIDKVILQLDKIISDANESQNLEKNIISIPIETIQIEPKITKDVILKYQIKDLVGQTRTSFAGSSADREHNIKTGIAVINGILIAPGEEFSTVGSIGRVTGAEGYRKETVIKQNKTAKEFGGGLCQVATTLFRLALNAGMPITERINHRFVVAYYNPPGVDAAIYGPHPDFRFVNDTGSYLLLQARVENKQVIMELYGRKDGRTVEMSKPTAYNRIPAPPTKYIQTPELFAGQTKCTEMPHDGLTTNFLYTVNYPDGIVKQRNFKSIYQPWQKVCLIGIS